MCQLLVSSHFIIFLISAIHLTGQNIPPVETHQLIAPTAADRPSYPNIYGMYEGHLYYGFQVGGGIKTPNGNIEKGLLPGGGNIELSPKGELKG